MTRATRTYHHYRTDSHGLRARLAATLGVTLAVVTGAGLLAAAPAGALGNRSGGCLVLTTAKADVHAAAVRREGTLATLVATLQARTDSWGLNAAQIGQLQGASAGISALDAHIQSACYATRAAFRADATPLWTNYRVYWLRVPQTHGIEAADRLADARARLTTVATNLAAHVGSNTKAQTDLASMNQELTAADASLGTPPTPTAQIAALPGLAPAADMTADVATMEAARTALVSTRNSLIQARADGLQVLTDLGA